MSWKAFRKEGGEYRQLAVEPGSIGSGKMQSLRLSDGSELTAGRVCLLLRTVAWQSVSRTAGRHDSSYAPRGVFLRHPQPGDARYLETQMPTWIDNTEKLFYGIPGNQWRGFKVAERRTWPCI